MPPPCTCGGDGNATRWIYLWDARRSFASGEEITLPALLGQPAVLLRNGSAVARALLAAVVTL